MALKITSVSKSFGDKELFRELSITFNETGIYSVIGGSGSGKTTLLRMISGLDNDYEGEIQNGGIQNVSFMFQEYRLFPTLTALENAVIPNGEIENGLLLEKAKKLFSELDFSEDDLNLLPDSLSGGMKQRVSFIRAFLRNTPILLLDEPTKELDEALRKKMLSIILSESKSRLLILVSHNENEHLDMGAQKIYLSPQKN